MEAVGRVRVDDAMKMDNILIKYQHSNIPTFQFSITGVKSQTLKNFALFIRNTGIPR
jgi:hypothetical protein